VKKTEKVGIVFSTYNNGKVAMECVASCLKQTYQNIEIVIADDGSSNGTVEELFKHKKKEGRLEIIRLEHGERGLARKKAIDRIKEKGVDYLYIIDADMILEKCLISKCTEYLKNNPEVGALVIPEEPFSNYDNMFSKVKVFERQIINNAGEDIEDNSIEGARFWRIKEYENIGGINPKQIAFEETQPTIRYLHQGGVIKRATFTKVRHDEKKVTIRNLLKKKAYYFNEMKNTISMEEGGGKKAFKRWYFFRSVLYRKENLRRYIKHPGLTLGVIFMYGILTIVGVYALTKKRII
jgi:glycosyltransferase involved in cell wall biosynthesis